MATLGLDYEEFQEVLHLGRCMGLDHCPPGFSLRRFLVGRLRVTLPEAAAKIEGLNDEQVNFLGQEIVARLTAFGPGYRWHGLGSSTPC
jgi:hypothetical protein